MGIEPYPSLPELFGLKIVNKNSEALKRFLIDNPFIGQDKNKEFIGFIFVHKDESESKQKIEKSLSLPGINEIRVIAL